MPPDMMVGERGSPVITSSGSTDSIGSCAWTAGAPEMRPLSANASSKPPATTGTETRRTMRFMVSSLRRWESACRGAFRIPNFRAKPLYVQHRLAYLAY